MASLLDSTDAEAVRATDTRAERRYQAFVLLGAIIGLSLCVTTLLSWSIGVFIPALEQEYGWSRADIALAVSLHMIVIFLGSAPIGRLADKVNPGRLAAISMAMFGCGLLATSQFVGSVAALWAGYILLTVVGMGTAPVVILKPVVAAFSERRGLAIGVAMTGSGIGAFALPSSVTALIDAGGWQAGYSGLGFAALAAAPLLWFTLGRTRDNGDPRAAGHGASLPGLTFGEAWLTRTFWLLSALSAVSGFGMGGAATHLIPFLMDHRLSAGDAAIIASALGVGSIAGRLVGGFALDRIQHPAIGHLFLGSGVAGLLLLLGFGAEASLAAALLIGFMIGAEIDLIAYFASRYFGLRAHATIFGWNYGMVALGSSSAPVLLGQLRDVQGNYELGFTLALLFLLLGAAACLFLGRYRFDTH